MAVSRLAPTQDVLERHKPLLGEHGPELERRVREFQEVASGWSDRSLQVARRVLGDPFTQFKPEGARQTLALKQARAQAKPGRRVEADPELDRAEERLHALHLHTDDFVGVHGERIVRVAAVTRVQEERARTGQRESVKRAHSIPEKLEQRRELLGDQRVEALALHAEQIRPEVSKATDEELEAWRSAGWENQPFQRLDADAARDALVLEEHHGMLVARARDFDFGAQQLEETGWRAGYAGALRRQADAVREQAEEVRHDAAQLHRDVLARVANETGGMVDREALAGGVNYLQGWTRKYGTIVAAGLAVDEVLVEREPAPQRAQGESAAVTRDGDQSERAMGSAQDGHGFGD